jgi:hypothetical protein
LTFRASPSVYRQLCTQWRTGALNELAGAQIRWLAELNPFPIQDDPQKGHWGGLPERNGRIVTATVSRVAASDWYDVRVEVMALPEAPALRGPVRAHLHDSFVESVVELPLHKRRAQLDIVAWGSFTIGIECDRGETHLELDLANTCGVDPEFIDEDAASEPGLEVASYGVDLPLALGTRWTYDSEVGGRYQVRVVERVEHPDGVVAAKLEGAYDQPLPPLVPAAWVLTRGDGRYYAVPDDPKSPMVRLRARSDDLRDVMVTENLFLRLRARPRTSFANAHCVVNVLDVQFKEVTVGGPRRNAVFYDVEQVWPGGTVKLTIVPRVGVFEVTDMQGNRLQLVDLSEGRTMGPSDSPRPRAARPARKKRPKTAPPTSGARPKPVSGMLPRPAGPPARKAAAKQSAARPAKKAAAKKVAKKAPTKRGKKR